jgi:hypothetical protein
MMLQLSVYARYSPSEEAAESRRPTVRLAAPPLRQVRLMAVTDHQFGHMEVFYGKKPREPKAPPAQIMLFCMFCRVQDAANQYPTRGRVYFSGDTRPSPALRATSHAAYQYT